MKIQSLLAATLAFAVTACDKPATTDSKADQTASVTKPVGPTQPLPKVLPASTTGGFSKEFMIGKWAEVKAGDCKLAQDFKADGSVVGIFERWSVSGTDMIITMMGETKTFSVKVIDQNHIDIKPSDNAEVGRLVRC